MNETNDPLETELAAFHPQELSPAFYKRVAGRLADPAPRTSGWLWGLALAGGLAAACLAAALLGQGGGRSSDPRYVDVRPRHALPDQADDALPTLRAYRHAESLSPEELDALLDKHAGRAPKSDPRAVQLSAFTRSEPR